MNANLVKTMHLAMVKVKEAETLIVNVLMGTQGSYVTSRTGCVRMEINAKTGQNVCSVLSTQLARVRQDSQV